jgi:hypothetical protein
MDMEMNMDEFDHRTMARMDIVLEEICRELKHGGNHESRKFVAERLMACARDGHTTLDELRTAACAALLELTGQKTA